MSAIYGLIGEASLEELATMGDRLVHRGSVKHEWSPAPGVYLGCRNFLACPQAQSDPGEPLVVSASLYDQEALAGEINLAGSSLAMGSERDLIWRAYQTYGVDCFERFHGEFVCAVWEEATGKLLLARDKLGCRILYYWQGEGRFAFASEYKALLALPDLKPQPDLASIQYFQATKYLAPGKSLLKDIASLPAAHWLEISMPGGFQLHRYWEVDSQPARVGENEAQETLRRLFLQSMQRRLVGVNLLQAELSGGIDSSAVVAAIRQLRPGEEILTYTIGMGPLDPEVMAARETSLQFNTYHQEVFVDPYHLSEFLPRMVYHIEDPVGRTESYLYYKLMEVARKDGKVVFGGTVSDSLFAGMPRHKILRMIQLFPLFKVPLEEFYQYVLVSEPPQSRVGKAIHTLYFGTGEKPVPRVLGIDERYSPAPLPNKGDGLLHQILVSGLESGVPNSMAKVEKTHMAHGVEFRSPFTDIDIINFSFSLPESYKIKRFKEKYILRQALLPLLPANVARRAKYPQRMNYDRVLSEVLDNMASQYLSRGAVQARGLFDPNEIDRLREHPAGELYNATNAMRLWTVIATEIWAQIFIDSRGLPPN